MVFSHFALALVLFSNFCSVHSHIALWHPSVYGFNASGIKPENWYDAPSSTHFLNTPLRLRDNLSYDEWWFHGLSGATPNAVMELPAGETITVEHSCNKGFTSYGATASQLKNLNNIPCNINIRNGTAHYGDPAVYATNGPLHAADDKDLKGCALSIAYKSDIKDVTPQDMVVFSVQHKCVWTRETSYDIPKNMPPCPNGKCICAWNWMHGSRRREGYANEIYMTGFDCNVTGSTSTAPLATPKVPVDCTGNSSACTAGAKQGLYWRGAVPDGGNIPYNNSRQAILPSYSDDWGFKDGAQDDIFETIASGASDLIYGLSNQTLRLQKKRTIKFLKDSS